MLKDKTYLYEQIVQKIISYIAKKRIRVGERLPSERKLAEIFSCNYMTIRKAIALMIDRQIVERRPGSGTYLRMPVKGLSLNRNSKISFQLSRLLAVIVQPDMGHYTNCLMNHLISASEKLETGLVIHPVADFNESSLELPGRLQDQGCKAIIIPRLSPTSTNDRLNSFLELCNIPTVTTFRNPGWEHLVHEKPRDVGISAKREIHFACKYFSELNYNQIAYIAPEVSEKDTAFLKISEYQKFMTENGLEPFLLNLSSNFAEINTAMARIAPHAGKMALICVDDDYALRLMTSLYKRGFSIPEDFAVIGCNNLEIGAYSEPPLSTIEFPYDYLAETLIIEALSRSGETMQVPPKLPHTRPIIRQSCNGKNIKKNNINEFINRLIKENDHEIK